MKNDKIIKLKDLNIDINYAGKYDRKMYLKMLKQREDSILKSEKVDEKIKNGEINQINNNSKNPIYLYIDKACPLSSIQFYNKNKDLIFTYPWNGLADNTQDEYVSLKREGAYDGFDGQIYIKNTNIFATEKGRIFIWNDSIIRLSILDPFSSKVFNIFNYDGTKNRQLSGGCLDLSIMTPENASKVDSIAKKEKLNKNFVAGIIGGDDFIDNVKSYVI